MIVGVLRRLIRDERGEDLVEYGLLAAFVATIAIAAIIGDPGGVRTSLIAAYRRVKTALDAQ